MIPPAMIKKLLWMPRYLPNRANHLRLEKFLSTLVQQIAPNTYFWHQRLCLRSIFLKNQTGVGPCIRWTFKTADKVLKMTSFTCRMDP